MREGTSDLVTIESVGPASEDAVHLIRQLDADLGRRYRCIPISGISAGDLADERFTFLLARINREGVGCGALRRLEPGVGEIKRMFVVPQFRRYGIARKILSALEWRAVEFGQVVLRLETGRGQPEAIALYKSSGYVEISGFGEYTTGKHGVCLEKRLH